MRYAVRHVTSYGYDSPVQVSHHAARLCPRETASQKAAVPTVTIAPEPAMLGGWKADYFGNPVLFFVVQKPHRSLEITVESIVEVDPPFPIKPEATPPWEEARARLGAHAPTHAPAHADAEARAAEEFLFASPRVCYDVAARAYAALSFTPGRPILEAVLDLTARIHADFAYDPSATTVETGVAEVLALRRGVCQDFAHLQIACLRAYGLPARYVSGYILTHPPAGHAPMVGGNASHAWVSVFVPGFGWVDVDPTNNLLVGDEHITVAWGRDYEDVSPLKGVVVGGSGHSLHVSVHVEKLPD